MKKYDNKRYLFIFCAFTPRITPVPNIGLWTLRPRFSSGFLSPRSNFPLGQRFPISNHVTSGFMSPRSFFPPGQRFPISNHVTSGFMSPRSFFPPGQRFPISNHVTSGFMSPRSLFTHWSVVSHPTSGHDVTDQSEASMVPIWAPFTTSVDTWKCRRLVKHQNCLSGLNVFY